MIKIENLVKTFGKINAVDGLNLTIEKGSVFGFVGPNGAGKTTTMKIMAGLMRASLGSIFIDDVDIVKNPSIIKEKIGYMPDFFGVYDNLKVSEYMDFYADAYYIPTNERKDLINNLLETVNLSQKIDSYVDSLSRGMKQRLCLARSLINDPDILILDEPASGLDPMARAEMKDILKQLKQLDKTIIISSHILPELHQMCSEIGIIDHGRLIDCGSINDIMIRGSKYRNIYVKYLNNGEKLLLILKEYKEVFEIKEGIGEINFSFNGDDLILSQILTQAVKKDVSVVSFGEKEGDLEDLFIKLTQDAQTEETEVKQ